MVQNLCQASSLIHEDDQIVGAEHSMGNIMPFIKYYLPETKVVPLVLHNDITLDEASKLGEQLANLMKPDTVILASVDFSHYLTGEEAAKKDEETLLALNNKNLGRIFSMNDDYLDSPPSIGVLFQAMNQLGTNNFKVLDHTNSGILLDNKKIQTTSYITLVFDIKD
jgi:AmmeMemoRadiSam system protein B